jgi:hypothetical protein
LRFFGKGYLYSVLPLFIMNMKDQMFYRTLGNIQGMARDIAYQQMKSATKMAALEKRLSMNQTAQHSQKTVKPAPVTRRYADVFQSTKTGMATKTAPGRRYSDIFIRN